MRVMNKQRRKQIADLDEQISILCAEVEGLRDEEQEYFDNMPESLQMTDKGDAAETAVAALDEAIEALTEACSQLGEAST